MCAHYEWPNLPYRLLQVQLGAGVRMCIAPQHRHHKSARAQRNQTASHNSKMLYADCRPFVVHIALDLKWYALFGPLEDKVGQLLEHSAAIIAGESLPACEGLGQVPLNNRPRA